MEIVELLGFDRGREEECGVRACASQRWLRVRFWGREQARTPRFTAVRCT